MRYFFAFLLCAVTTALFSQTKKIAFKSHSGSAANYKIALDNNLFDIEESNFGLPPTKEVYTQSLDSVIYISPSVTVLVKTNYRTENNGIKIQAPVNVGSVNDTVYNDALFSKKHSLDSIKAVLKLNNTYQNPNNKTIFIGFDNKKHRKGKNKDMLIPVAVASGSGSDSNDNNNTAGTNRYAPFSASVTAIVGGIMLLSLLAGLATWKYAQSRQRVALSPAR